MPAIGRSAISAVWIDGKMDKLGNTSQISVQNLLLLVTRNSLFLCFGVDLGLVRFYLSPLGLRRLIMKICMRFVRSSFLAVSLLTLPVVAISGEATDAKQEYGNKMTGNLSDALVVVERIVGVDAQGHSHTLYNEEDGRVYRLGNIDQAVHDMNARGIKSKGTFRSLQAVLSDTVYLMGENNIPRPAKRTETRIPESLSLSVNNLRITKDRVIAIYATNCENSPI